GNIIDDIVNDYDYKKIQNIVDAERLLRSKGKLKVYGPLKEYGIRNKNTRKLLHKASKKENFNITSHQSKYLFSLSRIINGYSAIEHEIGGFPLQKDVIQIIGQSGVHYTPTYIVRPGIKNIYADKTSVDREKLLYLNGEILFHNYYAYTHEFQNEERQSIIDKWNKRGIRGQKRAIITLKELVKAESKISVGGHGNPLSGIGTHWELWFMSKGMTNYQAL